MVQRVLFVCLGNICRSPTAEGVCRAMLRPEDDIEVDSAGTLGWHAGSPPDERAAAEAARHGIDLSGLRARKVTRADFGKFDLILAMDSGNRIALRRLAPPGCRADLDLFLSYGAGGDVPDPYYEGDFDRVYALIEEASRGLLAALRAKAA